MQNHGIYYLHGDAKNKKDFNCRLSSFNYDNEGLGQTD
jgi:hypothetical protein